MTPEERTIKLSAIPLDQVNRHHEWLRKCFEEELELRLSESISATGEEWDVENIYHCALLLHLISDVSDVPLMLSAKESGDMDLGIGFDWQFVFVQEPETLINYARAKERPDIEEWVNSYAEDYSKRHIEQWLDGKIKYFRPDE